MGKNGVTDKPTIVRDGESRTHEYRSVRLNGEQVDWLSKIARADSLGHKSGCLCVACRMRRELEP